nr:hypothetical protein [Nostoc parmelioides]
MAARLEDGSVSLWDVRGNKLASLNSSKLINNIEFSPDSQTIATRLEDGSVILWDKRGNKLASLNSSKSITNIEFSPDSQKIATISEDRTISLWNINGKVITKFKIDVAYRDITFSPDSKILILDDSYYSNNVSFLDLRTNKLEKFQLNYFGAKKKYFVNITTDKIVYLWDFTGKQLAKISPSAIVKNVEFSYVQKYIIFTLKNNTIEIWDFKGNKIGALQPNKKINRIEFSRNGKNLATINYDEKVINLWSIKGEKIADIPSPYNYYGAVRFSKDGKSLAVYSNYFYFSQGYSVYLWDIKGNPIAEIKSEGEVKFSPDNKFFTTVSKDKAVEIWDFQGNKLAVLRNQGWLNAVEWSQDGRNLTTNAIISNAHLWDFQGNQLGKLPFENRINPEREKYEFSPNGEHLITLPDNDASASDETKKIARLWSLKGNQPAVDLSYQGKFNDKDFSPDGLHIATASGDGAVRLWDIQGNLVKVFWHQRPVETVRFSLDAKNLLTVTADGVGRIWDLRGNLVAELKHRGLIERLEFSPNQQNLLTISQDEIVQLWNLSDQKSIDLKHRGKISSIVFSLDGQTIATNSQDNVARLWNLQGKSIAELKHPDWVKTIIFSKDGKYLISTVDHTARVWNLKGRQLAELSHPGQVAGEMTFSPDGQHLITNSYDHSHKVVLQVTGAKREKSTQSFTITTTTDSGGRANTSNLSGLLAAGLLWSSVLLMGLSGSYVLFKWLLERRNQESLQSGSPPDGSTPPVTNDYSNETDDELQVAQAVRHTARNSAELTQRPFAAGDEYFPVTRRQMKQSWRYLRQFVRQGLPTELDIEATVKEVSRHGFLLKPVLVPRRVNRTELLLLIDQDGSMIPFHFLSRQLAETALHGGRLAKTSVYYFRNCPHQHLYHDPHHQEAETVNDVLASIHEYTSVMIFSDGGVARRGISPERVEMTTIFLEKLKQRVRYIVWLNPIPRSRWHDTTAEEIAKLVPMFEFNRRSLHEAINVLRGKPAHSLTQL